ncbi:MAG: hypothetical protein IPM23_20880 [Candidatus Melainabacteria bacterium]|nr:hypothetical protein [Candidatus Melainabacteria bacterium]
MKQEPVDYLKDVRFIGDGRRFVPDGEAIDVYLSVIKPEELDSFLEDIQSASWSQASRLAFKRVFEEACLDPRADDERMTRAHINFIKELNLRVGLSFSTRLYQVGVKDESGLGFFLFLASSRAEINTYIQAIQDGYDISRYPAVMKSGTFKMHERPAAS